MVKSAASQIVKESAKVDLAEWLAGGKPRRKTATISRDSGLADERDALVEPMNNLLAAIQDAKERFAGGGIADDDPVAELEARWDEMNARYEELDEEYQASLLQFEFRTQSLEDPAAITKILADAGVPATASNNGFALVVATCVEPVMTWESLETLAEMFGPEALNPLLDAVTSLATKRKPVTAPLPLRP